MECSVYCLCPGFFHHTRCMYPNLQSDLISRIDHQMRYCEPKKLVFSGVKFRDILEICAHLQAECKIKPARYSLIIMIILKYVKRMLICFARNRVCTISIAQHFYCGWGVYYIDCSRVSYVQLMNQWGLFVDKIKIFKNFCACGLYTGALNRLKFTVACCCCYQYCLTLNALHHTTPHHTTQAVYV